MVVHEDFQRKGLGTRLGRYGLQIAFEENCPVGVIATPMGQKLYSTLGFETLETLTTQDGTSKCTLSVQVWIDKGQD